MNTVQKIFQDHGPAYVDKYSDRMPTNHKKVVKTISNCRTEDGGIAVYECEKCDEIHHFFKSCGNRHCPNCQNSKMFEWLEKRLKSKLPTHHFLITFTVPEQIRDFIRSHQRASYTALFKASSESIKALVPDPKYVGGDIPGILAGLHTWDRKMGYHPHVHCVVAGGAMSSKDKEWHPSNVDFFVPNKALSKIYRAKFRDMMKKEKLYDQIPRKVFNIDWNVHIQPTHNMDVIGYLAQYVNKVAISDHRIAEIMDDKVKIRYSRPGSNRIRHMILDAEEFIRRFLQHVLPYGFMKIRYYGLMHPCCRFKNKVVRAIIELSKGFEVEAYENDREIPKPEPPVCSICGGKLKFTGIIIPIMRKAGAGYG